MPVNKVVMLTPGAGPRGINACLRAIFWPVNMKVLERLATNVASMAN
jgi:hypothetical protein